MIDAFTSPLSWDPPTVVVLATAGVALAATAYFLVGRFRFGNPKRYDLLLAGVIAGTAEVLGIVLFNEISPMISLTWVVGGLVGAMLAVIGMRLYRLERGDTTPG
jgi:hypothetical protein